MKQIQTMRMKPAGPKTNPLQGNVRISAAKTIWYCSHAFLTIVALFYAFDIVAIAICLGLTAFTFWCGTVGLHRLLFHRSFAAPLWLERLLVYLGVVVGTGGPFGLIYHHDSRDWAQRHPVCHPFLSQQSRFMRDWFWNVFCRLELKHPPVFILEPNVENDRFYRFLQATWMAQQIPIAAVLFFMGGWSWVLWGVSARVCISQTGHWFIGFLAHNYGSCDRHLHGRAVQGRNLKYLGLLTFGEAWHNNHHAFPESARMGFSGSQADPGWWLIRFLMWIGLATEVKTPTNLPSQCEKEAIGKSFELKKLLVRKVE